MFLVGPHAHSQDAYLFCDTATSSICTLRQAASIFSAEQLAALQLALEDGDGSSTDGELFSEAPGAESSAGASIAASAAGGVATTATALSFLVDPVDMAL